MNVSVRFVSLILFLLIVNKIFSSTIVIVPSETNNDTKLIQTALDSLTEGDTLQMNGDFIFKNTIYLPSNFTWILNGAIALANNADLDEAGWVAPGIDARRRTGITEKKGGATNINMSGGIYDGNYSTDGSSRVRLINFVSVSNSSFHDMEIKRASDDNFTLGPDSRYNECRNLISTHAGLSPGSSSGNALTDKGDHNKWYDCVASDCTSDGWTPKCRYSEFYNCIAARNEGPGFGMFCRVDGSGNPVDLGEAIENNKFIQCESYENNASGFSFNISSTSGEGGSIRNNYIQAICYNNAESGVRFRNKQPNSIIEDNEINLLCYGNRGLSKSGSPSSLAGGVGTEGKSSSPVRRITGFVVCYDNKQWDVNINQATDCNIVVYNPKDQIPAVLKKGDSSNKITELVFSCDNSLEKWCQQVYCKQNTVGINLNIIQSKYFLEQNYPNPFTETTTIKYYIPMESFVSLNIYDFAGRLIKSLVNEKQVSGYYAVKFNNKDLSKGTYFYRLHAGSFLKTRKMILDS